MNPDDRQLIETISRNTGFDHERVLERLDKEQLLKALYLIVECGLGPVDVIAKKAINRHLELYGLPRVFKTY